MKKKIVYLIIGCIFGTAGWVYLFIWNWKIAFAISAVMFANNISNKVNV